MTDIDPTATVAGQSIALHVTGYPDLPNRWGSGHIRATGIRLDYGNSHTPNGRHALVTGTWVRENGEVTTDPIDRYYDAHDGDTSDWPDWLAQLVTAHDPSTVPVSSPPPDQTADERLSRVLEFVTSEVVTAKTEFGNGYREAQRDIRDLIRGRFDNDAANELRRLAAEAQQTTSVAASGARTNENAASLAASPSNRRAVVHNAISDALSAAGDRVPFSVRAAATRAALAEVDGWHAGNTETRP